MSQPLWTNTLGLLSTVVLIGFWGLFLISYHREVHYPGELEGVMLTLLVGLAFSLAAALKGSRWWFLATGGLLATIIVVMSRLH